MSGKQEMLRSILAVSASEQFDALVRRSIRGYITADFKNSISSARRSMMERMYDLVIINMPLRDETGEQFALDVAQRYTSSVLLVVPSEVYEDALEKVTDYGILVLPKPMPRGRLDKGIRYLAALQGRIRQLERKIQKAEEKAEEIRIIDRAKMLLIENRQMTEDEAHRSIGKQAMDSGLPRKVIAQQIIDDYE